MTSFDFVILQKLKLHSTSVYNKFELIIHKFVTLEECSRCHAISDFLYIINDINDKDKNHNSHGHVQTGHIIHNLLHCGAPVFSYFHN